MDEDLGAPGAARRLDEPPVARTPAVGDGKAVHDAQFVGAVAGLRGRGALRLDGEVEDLLLLTAEQRQDPMRRQLREGFAKFEIVAEFGAGFSLDGTFTVTNARNKFSKTYAAKTGTN